MVRQVIKVEVMEQSISGASEVKKSKYKCHCHKESLELPRHNANSTPSLALT